MASERARQRIVSALVDQQELLSVLRETAVDRFNEDPREIEKPKLWWRRWRAFKALERSICRLERRYFEARISEIPLLQGRVDMGVEEQQEATAPSTRSLGQVELPWDAVT